MQPEAIRPQAAHRPCTDPSTGQPPRATAAWSTVEAVARKREQLRRPYPRLERSKRRTIRRLFLFGLIHPDAMHDAIWGRHGDTDKILDVVAAARRFVDAERDGSTGRLEDAHFQLLTALAGLRQTEKAA